MAKRSTRAYWGSIYVFPGGKLDESDRSSEIYKFSNNLDDLEASARLDLKENGLAFWIACIRECFEEVGIIISDEINNNFSSKANINQLRNKLNAGSITFLEVCNKLGIKLATDSIIPIAHWITPTIESRRFDTWFFLVKSPTNQIQNHDGLELTESIWITPNIALEEYHKGKINLIMPTIKTLEMLTSFSSTDEAYNYFLSKQQEPIETILPKFVKKNGKLIGLLPDDKEYDSAIGLLPGDIKNDSI